MDKLVELRKKHAKVKAEYDEMKGNEERSMDEIRAKFDEVKELKERIDLLQNERDLELEDLPDFINATAVSLNERSTDKEKEVRDLTTDEVDKEYEGTFLRAFRGKKLTQRDRDLYDRMCELRAVPEATPYMQTDSDEDGGFIVPHSVSTMIQEYKREGIFDLTTLVDVQRTAVLSGEFTYEKLGTITPWENISQWEDIEEVETPQFERKSYKIEDYAGILPLPRTLLQDTDQNLLAHIAKYIAKKSIVTRNAKVLSVINATYTDKKPIATVDDIKDVLDLELDPAFLGGTTIVTNQFGYNFLRKLKDSDGNYLMQPDVTQPDRRVIDGKFVERVPARELPNVDGKAPIYFGDFEEAVRFFDRGVYEITPTTVGGKAFTRNSYDIRVIDRFDAIPLDKEAVVAGAIDLSAGGDEGNE